eukprot:1191017-Prorocentrum_minimum.AAC.8
MKWGAPLGVGACLMCRGHRRDRAVVRTRAPVPWSGAGAHRPSVRPVLSHLVRTNYPAALQVVPLAHLEGYDAFEMEHPRPLVREGTARARRYGEADSKLRDACIHPIPHTSKATYQLNVFMVVALVRGHYGHRPTYHTNARETQ